MINLELLKELYKINSSSGSCQAISKFIKEYVHENYNRNDSIIIEEDRAGNLYFTKGLADSYPTIVAHMDQVSSYKGPVHIFRKENIIIGIGDKGQCVNLGADDKNGVWIGLQLLRSEPIIKVAFFVDEEIGCQGSKKCDMTFFDDSRYVIQCDRRNGGDFITGSYYVQFCDKQFVPDELKEQFGYKDTTGLMTDVEALKKQGLKVAACNLSCGYYNPHTENEYTVVPELINCLRFVQEIIKITPIVPHEYKPVQTTSWGQDNYGYQKYYNWQLSTSAGSDYDD